MEIKLDKTKVYDLSELSDNEKEVLLKHLQDTSKNGWTDINNFKNKRLAYFTEFDNNGEWLTTKKPSTTNAKELFYTLENIQVDCRELSKEQIKEMANVCYNSGYLRAYSTEETTLQVSDRFVFFNIKKDSFVVGVETPSKNTITYEKFMELFGYKSVNHEVRELSDKEVEEGRSGAYDYADFGNSGTDVKREVDEIGDGFVPYIRRGTITPQVVIKYLADKDVFLSPEEYKKLFKK